MSNQGSSCKHCLHTIHNSRPLKVICCACGDVFRKLTIAILPIEGHGPHVKAYTDELELVGNVAGVELVDN